MVNVFDGNLEVGLPNHLAMIMLFDQDTGATCCVMDGTYITGIRTAASAVLSARMLGRGEARARGLTSPGYYGYLGPEFTAWLKANNEKPHRTLLGRKTYEILNALPEEARDDGWRKTTEQPVWPSPALSV